MSANVYNTIFESAKVAYHLKTGKILTLLLTTCPKRKFDTPNEWVLNITNKALTQI